jgi:hypothetical protein
MDLLRRSLPHKIYAVMSALGNIDFVLYGRNR